jgi:cell division protein FtsQ
MRQGAVRGGAPRLAARLTFGTAARGAAAPRRPRRRRLPRHVRYAALWSLPLVIVAGCYGVGVAGRMPVVASMLADAADRLVAVSAVCGLVVADIEVEGRETTSAATIMAALGAARGTPILAVSPSRAKEHLESLPWVRSATIERRLPGTLFVRLVERRPLAVWQHGGKQELIDRDGEVIPVTDLSPFARLPTLVGEDAAPHATRLIDMLAGEPELAARVTAAIRVGDRRWNLRVDNMTDVLLPEEDPAGAWSRLAQLERTNNLLKRDVQTVDLRLPDRLVLRVTTGSSREVPPPKKPHSAGKST